MPRRERTDQIPGNKLCQTCGKPCQSKRCGPCSMDHAQQKNNERRRNKKAMAK